MPRHSKPWKRSDRDAWYCWHDGRKQFLAKTKEEAYTAFHRLKAGGIDLPNNTQVSSGQLFDAFLEWQHRHRSKATYIEHKRTASLAPQ